MNQVISSVVAEAHLDGQEVSPLRDELLSELFGASCAEFADRPALEFVGRTLTYTQLNAQADRLAGILRARGIGRGCFVGLWMSRSDDLHVGLLAILKAGAAYLPFDCDAPAERIAACLMDCGAVALLIDEVTASKAGDPTVLMLNPKTLLADLTLTPAAIDLRAEGATPADAAYVIYTSGSTGTPKGVVISHRNICHFLRSAQSVYQLRPDDIVFQGGSVAFDLSLEEIFVPYLAGAKLWVASQAILQESDHLSAVMQEAGITVLDTVPTLLSLLEGDVPSLRLILTGGEALPSALVEKWARPSRRVFNTYGPTETTVVATATLVESGQNVTIGKPIPGYCCYVVDEAMKLITDPGIEGELLIGGPGVAGGYLNRPELTAEKFIPNPFAGDGKDPLLYRTGDAVSWDKQGSLVFQGRIDDQVKIRGFRVELGEIEAKLRQIPGISQAAVILRQPDGVDLLVAFLVVAPGMTVSDSAIRESLRAQLPSYMIPALFQIAAELPRLISGKLDRKSLQGTAITLEAHGDAQEQPQTATEAVLLTAAQAVFPGQPIAFSADFFLELGGHSLIAARFVSLVRKHSGLTGFALQDVYAARNLRAMAVLLDQRHQAPPVKRIPAFVPPPWRRRFLCGLAQALVMPFILTLTTAPWLGVFVAYELLSGEDYNFPREVGALLITYAAINLGISLFAMSGKWLVIGRTKPGRYPIWGVYYFRWWLSKQFIGMIHMNWFRATPIMRLALRVLGARIGDDAIIGDLDAGAVDLVTIGADTTLGSRVVMANAEIVGSELIIGRVFVGADVSIGSSCVLSRDVVIENGAELADLSAVGPGGRIGAWEKWEGAPARRIGTVAPIDLPDPAQAGLARRSVQAILYAVMLILLPPVALIPIIPAFYLLDTITDFVGDRVPFNPLYILPVMTWPAAIVLIFITVLLIAVMRWTILPSVKEGRYSVHSWFYFRKWMVALATELTLETLSSLYATVYMRNWFRLMGAKIGKDSEISTNLGGSYDLVEIGAKSFIADEVVLGDEDVRRGWMTLKKVRLAERVFVGNSAVVPPGADIPSGTLIGIKSRPPAINDLMEENSVWFGSPPLRLPVRQHFDEVSSVWTYEPSFRRRIARTIFEAFSVSLPSMLAITFGYWSVEILSPAVVARDYTHLIPIFIALSVAISFGLCLTGVALKWLVMGRYEPTAHPMWSWWALRTEAVAVNYWGMAGKELLDHLRGTPFLPWVFRLFGCRFGKGVFMDCTDITEFDCINVGDFSAINAGAVLQTHLYEDRVMKIGRVTIGQGVSISGGTTVLYDTKVGDYAQIGPLTIVMKGEEIPAHSAWEGSPAQPV